MHEIQEQANRKLAEQRAAAETTYRIIYRASGRRAFVYLVAAARRDLQELLHRRPLSA